MYSLAQAAKAAGKSKPTLLRAIRAGRLSATRHDDGTYAIDPAELMRAFPSVSGAIPDPVKQTVPHNGGGCEPGVLGEIEGKGIGHPVALVNRRAGSNRGTCHAQERATERNR